MRRAGSRGDGSLTSSGCTRTDSRRSSKRGHRTRRRRDQAGSAYSSVSLKKDDDFFQREEWDDKEEGGGRGERSQPWLSLSRSSIPGKHGSSISQLSQGDSMLVVLSRKVCATSKTCSSSSKEGGTSELPSPVLCFHPPSLPSPRFPSFNRPQTATQRDSGLTEVP